MASNDFNYPFIALSRNTFECLRSIGLRTIADLVVASKSTLMNIHGFGEKELQECVWLLKQYGVDFYGTPRVKIGTKKLDNILDQPIDFLEISNRAKNALKAAEIKTVSDLMKQSHTTLRKLSGLGMGSFSEVLFELHLYGLKLPERKQALPVNKKIEELTKLKDFTLDDLIKEINNRGFSVTLAPK